MEKYFEEFSRFVEINGFRNVLIKDAPSFLSVINNDLPDNVEVQLLNADLVASWKHLYFAVLNALMAHRTKINISKSIAVETVLYASAQRQIKKALSLIGVNPASTNIAIVLISTNSESLKNAFESIIEHINSLPDETVLELTDIKMQIIKKAFSISDVELSAVILDDDKNKALVDVVLEKVALLSTQV
ncbi:MAG: hypothetical protein GX638_15340 [Crenarchaeota archaeon]|nr:hypothetical protein [Thermoproteota archaeon]